MKIIAFNIILFCVMVFGVLGYFVYLKQTQSVLGEDVRMSEDVIAITDFDRVNFWRAVQSADSEEYCCLKGGIIPHHTLASSLIVDFLKGVSGESVSTIILLSPNHPGNGSAEVLTTDKSWGTEFGIVRANTKTVHDLLKNPQFALQENVIKHEHGITSILPYIAYFHPQTTIVPLVINNGLELAEIEDIAQTIADVSASKSVLIVGAFDFSHYQLPHITNQKDVLMRGYLEKNSAEAVSVLGNDFTDSPSALAMLMRIMEILHSNMVEIVNNTNSYELTGMISKETTSYFEVIYQQK